MTRVGLSNSYRSFFTISASYTRADLWGGCRGCAPLPPRDDLWFSNTTGILQKKTMWFIGVEVEQETSAPPPKKNPGSAPAIHMYILPNYVTFSPQELIFSEHIGY